MMPRVPNACTAILYLGALAILVMISQQKKCESTKVHLNFCANFRTLMSGMTDDEGPDWYSDNTKLKASNKATAGSH